VKVPKKRGRKANINEGSGIGGNNHDEEEEDMPSPKKHRTDNIDNHGENDQETVGAESFGLDAGVQSSSSSPLPTSSASPTFIE
jgi:hypothetical protein